MQLLLDIYRKSFIETYLLQRSNRNAAIATHLSQRNDRKAAIAM
jgi:hypothetical protein